MIGVAALKLRLRTLVDRAAALAGVTRDEVIGPSRHAPLVRVRFAVTWVARVALHASWLRIAQALGDRDKSTIIHAHRRAEQLRETDEAFRATTDQLLGDTEGEPRG